MNNPITITTAVRAPLQHVWDCWVQPEHITQWAFASDDWHAPAATNDVSVNGKFSTTMAAKDGSFQFEFSGVYTEVEPLQVIAYTMGDGRKARIEFSEDEDVVTITESFEPETENSIEQQQEGWQAILNNYKKHAEQTA